MSAAPVGGGILHLQRLHDTERQATQDPVLPTIVRSTHEASLVLVEWLRLSHGSEVLSMRNPSGMRGPARAIGGTIVLHQPQPVLGEEHEELLHAGKETRQCANVLQLLSR
jgi:hypothetical protein